MRSITRKAQDALASSTEVCNVLAILSMVFKNASLYPCVWAFIYYAGDILGHAIDNALMHAYWSSINKYVFSVSKVAEEKIGSIRTVKSLGMEDVELNRWNTNKV